ncbi:hypothetical protein B0H16DRAFT_1446892 [Mycena metata]|uniref:Uncharacterized protein n=1 Tax=Mycena metata TaxID=1033252 RepID=A0AAD7KFU5_9AGAR|nr:hypothetical protein B0H16DRAFT_1446892 [Mycena metata]
MCGVWGRNIRRTGPLGFHVTKLLLPVVDPYPAFKLPLAVTFEKEEKAIVPDAAASSGDRILYNCTGTRGLEKWRTSTASRNDANGKLGPTSRAEWATDGEHTGTMGKRTEFGAG